MTVFEQQNLEALRRLGFVQITSPRAAKTLFDFIKTNFAQEFSGGLKLVIGVGQFGTDNYIIHAVPQIVTRFKNDFETRIEYGTKQVNVTNAYLNNLREALQIITG